VTIAPTAGRKTEACDVLDELLRRGYRLAVETRRDVTRRGEGAYAITHGHLLTVRGSAPPDDLAAAMAEHRDELLAAACVLNPPVAWLQELANRCRMGFVFVSTRTDASGEKIAYRITTEVLAANVAAFLGRHPAHDGPALVPILHHALSQETSG
jgi:hypothetical protein